MSEMDDDFAAEEENKIINEEYKIWKKNAPYLYDTVMTHALDWPSLTCQWFPDKESPSNKPYTTHRLLLGTHTSGQAKDYLQIASVQIPKSPHAPDALDSSTYSDERGELGGHTLPVSSTHFQIIQRINHPGEVNRARYMPQNPDLLATKSVSGEVLVFDRTKHSSEPDKDGVPKPDLRLVGQTKEGYGLAWNPGKGSQGHVLSAGEDTTVCFWDVNSYTKDNSSIHPTHVFKGHDSVVGDIDWHATKETVFASVGDDKKLLIWDTRTPGDAVQTIQAHDREIFAVAFSPAQEHLLITGSADKTSILHDMRVPGKFKHTFEGHMDEVLHLSWSPHNPTIFASASSDRRVNIWDLSMIGVEQTPDDQEDGPPELVFIHGGHTARPTDFSWAPGKDENWMAATASEDNVLMVWQPTMRIWAGENVKVDERELEDGDPMEGVESAPAASGSGKGKAVATEGDEA